jgi:hypothetical protein
MATGSEAPSSAGNMSEGGVLLVQFNKLISAQNEITIATPPPRGVGSECELRAFGTSSSRLDESA